MISNPADYQFVTGITNDEVLINGQIMPWRDTHHPSAKNGTVAPCCLRGEDPCFLYEAEAKLLYTWYGFNRPVWQYSPKLDRSFMQARATDTTNLYDDTFYTNDFFCLSDSFPLSGTSQTSTNGYRNKFNEAFPGLGVTATMRKADQTCFSNPPVTLCADNVRKIFYDIHRLRSFVASDEYNTISGQQSVHVSEVEYGRSEADSQYEFNKQYPYWGSPGNNSISPYILGETYYHVQRRWGDEMVSLERARQWEADSSGTINVTYSGGVNFGRYATAVSALVRFSTQKSGHTVYSNTTSDGWYVIPATQASESMTQVQMSDIMTCAKQYASSFGVYSQFFTHGRTPLGVLADSSQIYNAYLHVQCRISPIFLIPDDINFKSINWTWTPT